MNANTAPAQVNKTTPGWLAGRGFWPALPALIFLGIFFILPMAVLLSFGFTVIERGEISSEFTLRYLTDALCLLLAYPLAFIYTLVGRRLQLLILVLTVAPLLTSAVVRTYAWLVILGGRRGLINSVLIDLGVITRPLRMLNSDFAVITGMVQIHLPFMILPLITVLTARDRSLEQASLGLGASQVKTFWQITLPLSLPGITAGLALVFALSYTNFIIPQLLGGGGYTTLAVQVYEYIVVILDWSKGAALALLLLGSCFGFILIITVVGNRMTRWLAPERTG